MCLRGLCYHVLPAWIYSSEGSSTMHPDLNSFKLSLHRGCRSRFLETIFNGPMRDNCVQTLLRHFQGLCSRLGLYSFTRGYLWFQNMYYWPRRILTVVTVSVPISAVRMCCNVGTSPTRSAQPTLYSTPPLPTNIGAVVMMMVSTMDGTVTPCDCREHSRKLLMTVAPPSTIKLLIPWLYSSSST